MYNEISNLIQQKEYGKALQLISDTEQNASSDFDTLAILEAEIYQQLHSKKDMFSAIKKGLQYNGRNYELYYMLGEYYLESNPFQAYLCFENAEFYCHSADDLPVIQEARKSLLSDGVHVPNASIIIVSYNAKKEMMLCLDSLRSTLPSSYEIIVVDNASADGITDYLKKQSDIKLICNKENAGFPKGCNQGIQAAAPDNDILLLNNDTVVMDNSIFWLRMGLYENASVGGTGSISNRVANHQQIDDLQSPQQAFSYAAQHNIPMEYPYEKKLKLIGFAFLLKRTILNKIGLLDEQFSPGNYEDDDISFRMIQNGYQLLLCRNSFIYHFGNKSFAKDMDFYFNLCHDNFEKLKKKHGIDLPYYSYERREVVSFIPHDTTAPLHILEIGCGMGATLGYLQNTYPNARVWGIELMENVVSAAQNFIPTIQQGNIETMELDYPHNFFDYIIFADVLEHLYSPEAALKKVFPYLKDSGSVLASIPNLMHYSVILDLLKGNFTYSDSGILDRTHLRFFTSNEIGKLFYSCGYEIVSCDATAQVSQLSEEDETIYRTLLSLPGVAPEVNFQIYQHLIEAKKRL